MQGFGDPIEKIESYSPTPSITSVRILITLALREKWGVGIGDASTAFLHAKTPRKTYVFPPHTLMMNQKNRFTGF